jgi:hypothetical protein
VAEEDFANATIKFDGMVRGPDEYGIEMFLVETPNGLFWFEGSYNYAAKGDDFTVTVRNFGLWHKEAAGSTTPHVRKKFSASEARSAEARLKAFFLGPKDNPGLPFSPFHLPETRCVGVNFPKRWITIA